ASLDAVSLGQQCSVPPTATWQSVVQAYGTNSPMQDAALPPSRVPWRTSQTLGHQSGTLSPLGPGALGPGALGTGTRSVNNTGWAQQAQSGGSVQRAGGGGVTMGPGVEQTLQVHAAQEAAFSRASVASLAQALLPPPPQLSPPSPQQQQQQQQLHHH
ncbi:unnamed protein product, partial [Laminaria digitata]